MQHPSPKQLNVAFVLLLYQPFSESAARFNSGAKKSLYEYTCMPEDIPIFSSEPGEWKRSDLVHSVYAHSLPSSLSLLISLYLPPTPSVSHSRMHSPLNKEFPKNHSSSHPPPPAIGQLCFHSNRLKDLNPPAHTESAVAGAFQGRLNLLVFDVASVRVRLNQCAHIALIHPKHCVHHAM